jgi:hypothetical protein
MRPQTKDSDLPHRTKVREEVLGKAERYDDELTGIFKVNSSVVGVLQRDA